MIHALKFVKGAVSKKDYQPALRHFLIKNGRVIGYDGVIALSSPIDLDIEAAPKAEPFIKAIERCEDETIAVNVTTVGRITLRSGKFQATIECIEDTEVLEHIQPEGKDFIPGTTFLDAIRSLEPFIGTDASRQWAMGVLLRGQSAYATNNIIFAQYWMGEEMPEINLPVSGIEELTRIGEQPSRVQISENSATFHFSGDRWLRTQLLSTTWPDLDGLLNATFVVDGLREFPQGFFEGVATISPFVAIEGRIFFRDGYITTAPEGDIGASVDMPGLPIRGAYHHKMLKLLEGVATHIDFSKHPKPCPFVGEKLRGVFQGMIDP